MTSLAGQPIGQKTFFKADRSQIKWNTLGTHVLCLTQTDVDQANKSYYGETGGLYLLSSSGTFDCRVPLDKEGPVHDFAWSPNSKEFLVIYGCKCTISQFDKLRSHPAKICPRRWCCSINGARFCTTSALLSATSFLSTPKLVSSPWQVSVTSPGSLTSMIDEH